MNQLTLWALGLALAALGVFVKAKMSSYDRKHEKHFDDITELKERMAAVEARIDARPRNGRSR